MGATRRVLGTFNKGRGMVDTARYTAELHIRMGSMSMVSIRTVGRVSNITKCFSGDKRRRIVLKAKFIGGMYTGFRGLTNIGTSRSRVTRAKSGRGLSFRDAAGVVSSVFVPVVPMLLTANVLVKMEDLLMGKFKVRLSPSFSAMFSMLASATCAFVPMLIT